MRLTPPKKIVFWLSALFVVLGLLGFFVSTLPVIGTYAFWFVVVGYALLFAGNSLKGF